MIGPDPDLADRPLIVHVITSLGDGGAEAILYQLCAHESTYRHHVVSLTGAEKYSAPLRQLGVEVHHLNMPRGRPTFSGICKLWRMLRLQRPQLVQTWMYQADFLGGLTARAAGCKNIFWGIHHASLDPACTSRATLVVARANASLSGVLPTAMVCVSEASMQAHVDIGYRRNKMRVVHNGVDVQRFQPRQKIGLALRQRWGVPDDVPLLGMVARYNPVKDHQGLLKALVLLRQRGVVFRCVLVGNGLNEHASDVVELIKSYHLREDVVLAGPIEDVPAVMNALDLHLLTSTSEGFGNVVAEAMACGTPAVATAVGCVGDMIGELGWVVPHSDPVQLADAIEQALQHRQDIQRWSQLQRAVRARIVQGFSSASMVDGYQKTWQMAGG